MEGFIHQLAQFVSKEYKDLSKLTLVIPSQRAVVYIKKALHEVYGRPFFAPNFITIDEFAKSFSSNSVIDPVELLFRFYAIYKRLGNTEDFETFLNWAPMLISDCNDIDRYMIDANQLFKNLRDIRELEQWSFGEDRELSESQKQFLAFWDQLKAFYHELNEDLSKDNLAYSGSIMRHAADSVLDLVDELYPNQQFIFAGFNALSESELQLISKLVRVQRAKVILEGEEFYMNNPNHEAGLFIRKTKERIPESIVFMGNKLLTEEKQMTVISCAQSGSMLKVTQDLLSKMSAAELSKTVLLLADESLIVPAIKHIPISVQAANITLGLPIKLTALRPWVELIFEFQRNFEYFKTNALYHKTITAFFKHPFIEVFLEDADRAIISSEESNIIKYNKIFTKLELKDFSKDLRIVLETVFKPWKGDFRSALENFSYLNKLLFEKLNAEHYLLERSAIYHFHDALGKLTLVFERDAVPEMTLRSFEKFFTMRCMRESVAYYGNPIDGLQVMGMLETRMLDFENAIVVGLNEGIMPPKNNVNSLIPMDLRRYFGLPLPADKDAIFAHHFYRIVSHAKNLHVLYSTNQGDDLAAAEPSRYMQQIQLELQAQSKIQIQYKSYNIPVNESIVDLSFQNTAEVQQRILAYFQRGLSPSALNKFLQCPLDFYIRYVLKYNDDEDVEEGIESSTFGDVVHNTLEALYRPFVGEVQPVTPKDIDRMLNLSDAEVERLFREQFDTSVDVFDSGAMYFAMLAAKKQVRRFLKYEQSLLVQNPENQLFIISLEQQYSKSLTINLNGKEEQIEIIGKIDRIDRFGNELRIIDYKTGKCDAPKVTISGERFSQIYEALQEIDAFDFSKFKNLDYGYVLQLLFYLVIYRNVTNENPDAIGILSMRNLNDGLQKLTLSPGRRKSDDSATVLVDDKLAQFTEAYIRFLAEKIINTDNFQHNPKSKYCILCD